MKNRALGGNTCSIFDINSMLDGLVSTNKRDKREVILSIVKNLSAVEQKWLIRVILKDLKIGTSEKTVLNTYHPDALEFFKLTSDLNKLSQTLHDPKIRHAHIGVTLFSPIKPMLSNRIHPEKVRNVIKSKEFSIEEKLDGERVQVHKSGTDIKLFTRNSNDVTDVYASLIPDLLERITTDNTIIDGELLVWDSITGQTEPFGRLKSLAAFQNTGQDNAGIHYGKNLFYTAFDVLYVNDGPVMNLPYSERYEILKRCLNEKSKVLEVITQIRGSTHTHIIDALDHAIENMKEGIIIKDLDSAYVPDERKDKWIKIKPEYLEGTGDDLDLIVLGGLYGTGSRKGGTISQFLMGVKKTDSVFYSVCRVGSGFTDRELSQIQTHLHSYWKPFDPRNPPSCIKLHTNSIKDKPDVWIDPKSSVILQIKAAQITPTDKYKVGYTLRFPRIIKLRADKSWDQCMDYNELITLAKSFGGFISKRKYSTAIKSEPKTFDTKQLKTVEIVSSLFRDLEFCVMSGDDSSTKEELEALIQSHGGKTVIYPSQRTFAVIGSKKTLRISNIITEGNIDVVLLNWIRQCIKHACVIPLEPRHVLHAKIETKKRFSVDLDIFGDSYETNTDVEILKETFTRMGNIPNRNNIEFVAQFDSKYKTWWGLFRDMKMYFDLYAIVNNPSTPIPFSGLEMYIYLAKFYGGTVVDTISEETNVIIFDTDDNSRIETIQDILCTLNSEIALVSKNWILDCIAKKSFIPPKSTFRAI